MLPRDPDAVLLLDPDGVAGGAFDNGMGLDVAGPGRFDDEGGKRNGRS